MADKADIIITNAQIFTSDEKDLREVLGHTPLEVMGGILLGLIVAIGQWLIWK